MKIRPLHQGSSKLSMTENNFLFLFSALFQSAIFNHIPCVEVKVKAITERGRRRILLLEKLTICYLWRFFRSAKTYDWISYLPISFRFASRGIWQDIWPSGWRLPIPFERLTSWSCDFLKSSVYATFQVVANNFCWSFYSKLVDSYPIIGYRINLPT